MSLNPQYHVYVFVRDDVRYIQVNELDGTIDAAVATANGAVIAAANRQILHGYSHLPCDDEQQSTARYRSGYHYGLSRRKPCHCTLRSDAAFGATIEAIRRTLSSRH